MEKLNLKFGFSDFEITKINKASVVFEYDGELYYASKNIANKILVYKKYKNSFDLYVVEEEYKDRTIKWLGAVSRF